MTLSAGGRGRGRTLTLPDRDGYLRVKISGQRMLVRHLVMAAWIGECPPGMERPHGPGGQKDNSVTNLRFGTHQENERD